MGKYRTLLSNGKSLDSNSYVPGTNKAITDCRECERGAWPLTPPLNLLCTLPCTFSL